MFPYKSPAEKAAYLEAMMDDVVRQKPYPVDGDVRDVSNYSVGEIALSYGISSSGARTYSIPIYTAPDIKYAPALFWVYNSQGGYGYGGYGWDIGGLSVITLTQKSLYWDDDITAASVDDTDPVFCLDGIRLVRNTNSATKSSFPLVTATGPRVLVAPVRGQSDYVTSFTVLYPDGSRATFGTGSDLGFTLPSYPMTSSTSLTGEKIDYCYTLDTADGNHAIDSVRYGIDAAGHAAAVIRFASSPSSEYRYYAGKKVKRLPTVSGIESVSSGVTLYSYGLSYHIGDRAKLLSSVTLTNAAGESLPPLSFTYGVDVPIHFGQDSIKVLDTLPVPGLFAVDSCVLRRGKFLRGSYDDGIVTYRNYPVYEEISTGVFGCTYPADSLISFAPCVIDNLSVSTIEADAGFLTAEAVDVDGDGIDEVVKVCQGGKLPDAQQYILNICIYERGTNNTLVFSRAFNVPVDGVIEYTQGNSITYSPYRRTFRWGDFLGNGKTQLLAVSYSDNGYGISQTPHASLIDLDSVSNPSNIDLFVQLTPGNERNLICADLDNDGRTEICFATTSGLVVDRWGQNNTFEWVATHSNITQSIIDSEDVYYSDINADGYLDIIKAPTKGSSGTTWTFYLNTGTDFVVREQQHIFNETRDEFFFIDINRDGYPDILNRRNGVSLVYYLNEDGMGFHNFNSSFASLPATGFILPANIIDYSAMSSFIIADSHEIYEYEYTSYSPLLRHLVQSCDSYGKIVRNTYGYLPQSSLYWTNSPTGISAADGYQLRVLPLYVLTGAKGFLCDSDTSQVMLNDTYSWWDGVVNIRGLGFCGFSKTRTVGLLDGVTSVSINTFNPQKRGVPVSAIRHTGSESAPPYHSVAYTFDNNATTYGKMNPRLTQVVETDNLTGISTTTTYAYDSFDYPTSVSVGKSVQTSSGTITNREWVNITYSHKNNPSKYILGAVKTRNVNHDFNGDGVSELGERFSYTLDTLCRPVLCKEHERQYNPADVDARFYLASTARWQYDARGNIIREESAPSGSSVYVGTSYSYDSSGRHLVSSTDALGHTTSYSGFDIYGNPSIATNHKGQQTHSYRDGWGRVTRTVHPDGTVDSLARAWGGTGVYKETALSSGAPDVTVDFDAASREVLSSKKRFNGQWQKVRTQYNQRGLTSQVSIPYRGSSPSYWSTYTYDNYGRVTRIAEASGRKTIWSYSGTSVTERKDGIRTTRTMSPAGALLSVDDSLSTITYDYLDDGQPASISSTGGAATTFAYDTLGRRTSITDPSAGTRSTSYQVNADGSSVVTETNTIGSIATSYDHLGRVTGIVRPDFNTTCAYDTCGRMVSSVSTNGTLSRYTYDAYDRVLTVKDSVPDGKWLQRAYTYNAAGNVATAAYTSQGGYITTETYTYTNGYNTSIKLPDNTAVFSLTSENDLGQPTAATTGSVSRTYGYTAYGQPTYRKMNNGSLQNYGYSFDAATGNLLSRSFPIGHWTATEYFSYDNLGRLTRAANKDITYDANSNIISTDGGTSTMVYGNAVHPYQITGLNVPTAYPSDTPAQVLTYKAYDRPATITQGDTTATLTYNANCDRVRMQVSRPTGNLIRHYLGRYETEYDAASGVTRQNLYLGGDAYSAPMVLQKVGSGNWTPYIIGRDHLGSITDVISSSGTSLEKKTYGAWGSGTPSSYLWRGWCGHEYLDSFSLVNMNARLYDPILGRFLSPDPFIQAPDLPINFNRYAYCLNNPLKYNDPDGEFVITTTMILVTGAIIGATFGGIQGYKIGQAKGLSGWDMFGCIAAGSAIGGAAAFAGGYVATALAPVVAAAGYGGFVGGAITGAFSGAAAGAINGLGFGALSTGTLDGAFNAGAQGMALGMLSGAAMGGIMQGISAKLDGKNFWTGKEPRTTIDLSQQTVRN
ncbi:MAG: VCBS repeat-containing protein, partial [Bacteroidales bacterium]|nr:VCBS repeat-containing protein [Bacteroidales bacterium]